MKVKELKELLENYLDILENYEDSDEIHMVSNTYFLDGAKYFLGIAGYNGGYINLANLEEEIYTPEEESEEEGGYITWNHIMK